MRAAQPRRRLRQALLNCALLAATMLLLAGFLEVALRLIFARSLDFSMEMWKYAVSLKQPVPDPRLSFVHRPNSTAFLMGVQFSINSMGLRDREFPREKPPGVYRIVWLGDSTTLGWGVPLSGTAPKILERELNAAGHGRFEVLNAGVGNYNTVQEVEHYLTIDRSFHPDLVILEYFINDAESVPRERSVGLLGRSYLAAFALSHFDGALRVAGLRPRWREYYASLYRDGSPGLEAAKDAGPAGSGDRPRWNGPAGGDPAGAASDQRRVSVRKRAAEDRRLPGVAPDSDHRPARLPARPRTGNRSLGHARGRAPQRQSQCADRGVRRRRHSIPALIPGCESRTLIRRSDRPPQRFTLRPSASSQENGVVTMKLA